MAENVVIGALKANSKSFNLSSKKLKHVPKSVSKLTNLAKLQLSNNWLTTLPVELQSLQHLTELNLGNNTLEEIPSVVGHLTSLRKLYLFGNKITSLPPAVLGGLPNLVILNLNHNCIQFLPSAIDRLVRLKTLSVTDNRLEEIPVELCSLDTLVEINLTNNDLIRLPQQLYNLSHLSRLYLARNKLKELPEGIVCWSSLRILDVAGNNLSMFPVDFQLMILRKLHCEDNNFVPCEPIESVQEVEVLSLKELAARLILVEDRDQFSVVHEALLCHPTLASTLQGWGLCGLCSLPFLTTWLECVQFINLHKDMRIRSHQTIPVRVLLCSYKCFNKSGHSFYGVGSMSEKPSLQPRDSASILLAKVCVCSSSVQSARLSALQDTWVC
ncbi:leucine-rich repeat-containing protein 69 [Osmerus mordax]|uniref:leucine-rich repeat-containing protein 69 n=1 Tax=Osmerus mordax TaxID=8014 RepID=UPI00350EF70E